MRGGYLAIDPQDENIIYASEQLSVLWSVSTEEPRSARPSLPGRWEAVPRTKRRQQAGKYRDPWTPVLVFSPVDKRSLYLGTQYVMKTVDGGLHWQNRSARI